MILDYVPRVVDDWNWNPVIVNILIICKELYYILFHTRMLYKTSPSGNTRTYRFGWIMSWNLASFSFRKKVSGIQTWKINLQQFLSVLIHSFFHFNHNLCSTAKFFRKKTNLISFSQCKVFDFSSNVVERQSEKLSFSVRELTFLYYCTSILTLWIQSNVMDVQTGMLTLKVRV